MKTDAMDDDFTCLDYNVIKRKLDNGTFSTIHEAEHKTTKEKCVIKIIAKAKLDREIYKFVLDENKLLAELKHPNIINILQFHETYDHFFIFLSFLRGGNLASYLEKNAEIEMKVIFKIFFQLLNAIRYCHSHDVIHRDIKLENIMLVEENNDDFPICLIDFGLATIQTKDGPLLTDFPGTPLYAAPELIRGKPYDGRLSDVWAMGCVLYALKMAKLPFYDKDDIDEIYYRIQCCTPDSLSEIKNKDLKSLILSMLEKRVGLRPTVEGIYESRWITIYSHKYLGESFHDSLII